MKALTIIINLTVFLLTTYTLPLTATIRYVSHTGSSTPPYTTWETAADSIQKCIDYSVGRDTIIVANGVYFESLIVNKYLWLIGSSMDSTVINGTGLNENTVDSQADFNIAGFTIVGKGREVVSSNIVSSLYYNVNIENCKMYNAGACIAFGNSSGKIDNVILSDCDYGFGSFCAPDTCHPEITNSIIIMEGTSGILSAISIFDGGNPNITNNIIIGDLDDTDYGMNVVFDVKTITVKNNVVSSFTLRNIEAYARDTALVENNIVAHQTDPTDGSIANGYIKSNIRNNITAYNKIGIRATSETASEYNLFWGNVTNTAGGVTTDSTDVLGYPMFVKDIIPTYGGSYDYHLQKYSPAIDAGDPDILDVDGSRSDLGIFGGPYGQIYTYQDLAPKPPANLTAVYDSGLVKLTWNKNTEADLFCYRVYRDTVPNFIYDTTKIIAVVADTFYFDDVPEKYLAGNYYYKITAIDSAYHQSAASEEVHVLITGAPEGPPIVVEEYKLLNNYPNPFNPSTKIPYRLKEGGYVKLMVYDIKGELMKVLVNEHQNAGYYEVEFSPNESEIERGKLDAPFETGYRGDVASGIYLYRIEVIGEGRIPRFSDMKKMILVK